MEYQTLRARIAKLVRKSRKALRLYTTMGRLNPASSGEFADAQIAEWKNINSELLQQLSTVLEIRNTKKVVSELFTLRDRFYSDWRMSEAEMHSRQKSLLRSAEQGDFIKAAHLSRELVSLKARVQATQAAHHELQELVDQSKAAQPTIELSTDQVIHEVEREEEQPQQAKVIPLRRV